MTLLLLFIFHFSNIEKIPPLNQRIVHFVDLNMGKKVGQGECWDLAAAALDYAGGYLDRSTEKSIYIFGKRVNPRKGRVFPGDIIQFENVEIRYTIDNTYYIEKMPHHTAIIYEVLGRGQYRIAHQNTAGTGRKVGVSFLDLSNITTGEFIIYRPVPAGKR